MSDQQELRQRREALVQAVNRHDLEAVRSFIHPTYVGKTKQGFSVGYKEMVPIVEQLFAPGKDYQETVEIEEIDVSGDCAKLVTRRTERGRFYDPKKSQMFIFLGLLFLLLFAIYFLKLVTVGEWDDNNGGGAVGFGVASVLCIGLGFFVMRPRHRTVRYQETWRTIDGNWLMVEEQEL